MVPIALPPRKYIAHLFFWCVCAWAAVLPRKYCLRGLYRMGSMALWGGEKEAAPGPKP